MTREREQSRLLAYQTSQFPQAQDVLSRKTPQHQSLTAEKMIKIQMPQQSATSCLSDLFSTQTSTSKERIT